MSQFITIRAGAAGFAGLKHLRETLKLSLRAALHRHATSQWLELLNSHPLFADLVKARPRLIYKIYRPYLSDTMDCAQRVQLLQGHYRHVFRLGLGRRLPPLEQGDLLAVMSAGAYGMAMSSNYNSRPRAAEVLVDKDSYRVIRERERVDELWRSEV